jgi:hypothetical protein
VLDSVLDELKREGLANRLDWPGNRQDWGELRDKNRLRIENPARPMTGPQDTELKHGINPL